MPPRIEDLITYEVKRDIANRYFGFRKLIEEDKIALAEKIRQHDLLLEKKIGFELIRIYILLREEKLIHRFLELSGLKEALFYDPYLTESGSIRERMLQGVRLRGFSGKRRFQNAITDCYQRLAVQVDLYKEQFHGLVNSREMIRAEIKLFYQKNDLGSILSFLRALDAPGLSGHMQGGLEPKLAAGLEKKLWVAPPEPIEDYLPELNPLAQHREIRGRLKTLAAQAFHHSRPEIRAAFTRKSLFAALTLK